MANPSKPKYQDPAKPENTWAGKGKQPGWLKEKLEAGASLMIFWWTSRPRRVRRTIRVSDLPQYFEQTPIRQGTGL
jgi:hypothetical protein